jgi:DNA repair ATPase RecN
MLQLLDLARENAALRCELVRTRQRAEELQRLLSGADDSDQTASGASAAPRFWQTILGAAEEV